MAGAIQPNGRILFLGYTWTGGGDILLASFNGDSVVPHPVELYFDVNGRADISVFRPSDRTWYLNRSTVGFSATQFGLSTDKITPADFDGDGKTDSAVFRPSTSNWFLNQSSAGVSIQQFGTTGDVPVPSEFVR